MREKKEKKKEGFCLFQPLECLTAFSAASSRSLAVTIPGTSANSSMALLELVPCSRTTNDTLTADLAAINPFAMVSVSKCYFKMLSDFCP